LLTIVGEVNLAVHAVSSVYAGGCSHVGSVVVVYFKVRSYQDPYSDIELPASIQQRPLYSFLNNPARVHRFGNQKAFYLFEVVG